MPRRIPIYYPLRANAYGLIKGAPLEAFKQRLKVAALLHDHLALDDGSWIGSAGPRGATEMRLPGEDHPNPGLQSAAERRRQQSGEFMILVGGHPVIQSPAVLNWRATYRPIRDELPRAYPWIEFGSAELNSEDKHLANEMAKDEERAGLLATRLDDQFTRSLVLKGATHSMVLAARMGAALSTDWLHGQVVAARVARGEGKPVPGPAALLAIVPDVRRLTWEDVDTARRLRGLPRLRDVLAEVEQGAAAGTNFDEAALREFQRQYSRAVDEAGDSWGSVGVSVGIGTAVSLVTTPIAGPAGVASGLMLGAAVEAGRHLVGRGSRRNTWMAAADTIRDMAERQASKPPVAE